MEQTVHGGDLATWEERLPGVKMLDFSANINPLGMPESVRGAYRDALEECVRYPDPLCRELRGALSAREGVHTDRIVCGNGASDLIGRIAHGFRPARALVTSPTFSEYERMLAAAGCSVRRQPLRAENGFALGEEILESIPGVDMVFLCSPNNPTGLPVEPALLERVHRACAESGALLVVDECFRDFLERGEDYSAKKLLDRDGELIVLNAFTKSFAMPGLRLGYAMTSGRELFHRLERAGAEWSVSVPAQRCGAAAAGEDAFLRHAVELIRAGRRRLASGLESMGLRVFPSKANFLLFQSHTPDLALHMAREGILIRHCRNFPGLGEEYYRVAVRLPDENEMLLTKLEKILRWQRLQGQKGEAL